MHSARSCKTSDKRARTQRSNCSTRGTVVTLRSALMIIIAIVIAQPAAAAAVVIDPLHAVRKNTFK